jgi:hypothetical protein
MPTQLIETFAAMFSDNPGMTELLAISALELAAITLGMITFGITYANNARNRRRTRALEFITQITITEPMVSEGYKLYELLIKFQGQKPMADELTAEELKTVIMMCSFYEFLGLSLLQKLVNREVVLLARYALMAQTWDAFENVIKERRDALGRKFLFGSFEKAVIDLETQYQRLQYRHYPEQH